MAEFRMPALGADMESGTLVAWKVKPGDRVKRGDLVATVETVKGAIEVEIFLDGVVEELLVTPGAVVPVGGPMARVRVEGERPAAFAPMPARAPVVARPETLRAEPLAPQLFPSVPSPGVARPAMSRAEPLAPPLPASVRTSVGAGPEAFRAQPPAPPGPRAPDVSPGVFRAVPVAPGLGAPGAPRAEAARVAPVATGPRAPDVSTAEAFRAALAAPSPPRPLTPEFSAPGPSHAAPAPTGPSTPDVAGPEVFLATPLAPPLPPPARAPDVAGPEVSRAERLAAPLPASVRALDVAGPEEFHSPRATPPIVHAGPRGPDLAGPPAPAPPARRRASPVARRMAEELGIDLSTVAGSGTQGEVLRADVEAAAKARAAPPPPPPGRAKAPFDATSMRKAIADTMARSKREIPHYYLGTEIDLGRALAWLERENENRSASERVLPAALLLKATAAALVKVPELNGTYEAGAFRPSAAVHLGVAVHLRAGGLLAPAIHDAQALGVVALMARLADLVARARDGGLKASELSDSTVTVTNLGELGVSTVFPVILPPQVAMVGFGKVAQRPWVVDGGAIGPRPIVVATLAADHRVSDGRVGARFLGALDALLQAPEAL